MTITATATVVDFSVDIPAEFSTIDDLALGNGARGWCVLAGVSHGLWVLDKTNVDPPNGTTVVLTLSGVGRWTGPLGSGGGGGGVPPLTQTIFVDGGTAEPIATQDGSIAKPYSTIQAAIDTIPAGVDSATIRRVYVVLITPGTYDEDLVIDGTRRHIALIGLGPWNLGTFNGANWAPSGVPRNITWTLTAGNIDSVRHSLTIGTQMVPGEGLSTHPAYLTGPRISGRIIAATTVLGGTTGELYVQAQVFDSGATGSSVDASGYTGILNFYTWRARFNTAVFGPAPSSFQMQVAEKVRFGGLITCDLFSRIDYCQIEAGLTCAVAAPAIQPSGITNTNFAGTFTGPAGSARMDGNTNYWFNANGALLGGAATKVIQEDQPSNIFSASEAADLGIPVGAPVVSTPAFLIVGASGRVRLTYTASVRGAGPPGQIDLSVTFGDNAVPIPGPGAGTGTSLNPGEYRSVAYSRLLTGLLPGPHVFDARLTAFGIVGQSVLLDALTDPAFQHGCLTVEEEP